MTGRTLSHFDVLEKLGEGGMGVVYKARDTQLNRFVAIKLLPPDKVADPERRRRFIQEARAASALSHPNIITIYEISQADGADFIAMEFVPGRTLDELIPRTGMKLTEALRIAVQVADGLARAHAAGIVHRDLKPSNIMVDERDGQRVVKILDFGLAKLIETAPRGQDEATLTEARLAEAVKTEDGRLVGTVAYMSPEQAEGKPVNASTDIFGFGAVLYEMLSGRRAFPGATVQATLAALMRDDPPPILQIPHDLEKLVARCLRKDPARRAQHMADVKLALEEFKEESESGIAARGLAPGTGPAKRRRGWIPVLAGIMLAAAAGLLWKSRARSDHEVSEMQAVVLTSGIEGGQGTPSLSPDGKQVAFSSSGDIYVQLVDAGTPVRVTQDPASEFFPSWSPDGRFLAFVRLGPEFLTGAYYVIPALGGAERKVADIPRVPTHRPMPSVDWSADSKSLVVVDTSVDPPALAQVSLEDGASKKLTSPPARSYGDFWPAVSPDGKWLAFNRLPGTGLQDWKLIPYPPAAALQEPVSVPFAQGPMSAGGSRCAWTVDSAYLVCVQAGRAGTRLVRLAISGSGKSEPILAAGTDVTTPSIARQASRLAFIRSIGNSDLWRADLRDPKVIPVPAIRSNRQEAQPDYSPDGASITFISWRSGAAEVWTARADGSNSLQITTQAASPTAPRWSPDGRRIAFSQVPDGNRDVFVVNAQGGTPRRMTTDPGNDASAYWSRDGKWIYFASNRTSRQEVWKIRADGSAREVQVTRNGGWRSRESFDGKVLYYQKFELPGLFRMPVDGGPEERIGDVPPLEDWHLAPEGIYYFRQPGKGYARGLMVDRLDVKSGRTTEVLKLPPEARGGTSNFTVSPDGRWLVFVRAEHFLSELLMIDNFR